MGARGYPALCDAGHFLACSILEHSAAPAMQGAKTMLMALILICSTSCIRPRRVCSEKCPGGYAGASRIGKPDSMLYARAGLRR